MIHDQVGCDAEMTREPYTTCETTKATTQHFLSKNFMYIAIQVQQYKELS